MARLDNKSLGVKIFKFILNLLVITPAVMYQAILMFSQFEGGDIVNIELFFVGFIQAYGINVVLDLIRFKSFNIKYLLLGLVTMPIRPITQVISVIRTFLALFSDTQISLFENCMDEPTFKEAARAYFFHITTSSYDYDDDDEDDEDDEPVHRPRSSVSSNGTRRTTSGASSLQSGGSDNTQEKIEKSLKNIFVGMSDTKYIQTNSSCADNIQWVRCSSWIGHYLAFSVNKYNKSVIVTGTIKADATRDINYSVESEMEYIRRKAEEAVASDVKRAMSAAGAVGWQCSVNIKMNLRRR